MALLVDLRASEERVKAALVAYVGIPPGKRTSDDAASLVGVVTTEVATQEQVIGNAESYITGITTDIRSTFLGPALVGAQPVPSIASMASSEAAPADQVTFTETAPAKESQ